MDKIRTLILASSLCVVASGFFAADENNLFGGTVFATLMRGTDAAHFLFTRKGGLLRIENASDKLDAINIIDLGAKKLTIVYPHNTTFVHLDFAKEPTPSGAAPAPPNFPATLNVSALPSAAHIGPAMSPPSGFPSPPPIPSMPQTNMPNNPAMGVAGMGMLPVPMMPPPVPGVIGAAELKKTDKTKKIQGFECTLYTASDRGENFEIWATNDSSLFPFRLIEHDYLARHFCPRTIEETWPELLRNKSLFPLEATLRMEPGSQARLSFKVDRIGKQKIDNVKLFEAPNGYQEISAP